MCCDDPKLHYGNQGGRFGWSCLNCNAWIPEG